MTVIGVYALSNTCGIKIYECNDEYVLYEDHIGKFHHTKIYTDTKRAYFKYLGHFRIHLDECFRV